MLVIRGFQSLRASAPRENDDTDDEKAFFPTEDCAVYVHLAFA